MEKDKLKTATKKTAPDAKSNGKPGERDGSGDHYKVFKEIKHFCPVGAGRRL